MSLFVSHHHPASKQEQSVHALAVHGRGASATLVGKELPRVPRWPTSLSEGTVLVRRVRRVASGCERRLDEAGCRTLKLHKRMCTGARQREKLSSRPPTHREAHHRCSRLAKLAVEVAENHCRSRQREKAGIAARHRSTLRDCPLQISRGSQCD